MDVTFSEAFSSPSQVGRLGYPDWSNCKHHGDAIHHNLSKDLTTHVCQLLTGAAVFDPCNP